MGRSLGDEERDMPGFAVAIQHGCTVLGLERFRYHARGDANRLFPDMEYSPL